MPPKQQKSLRAAARGRSAQSANAEYCPPLVYRANFSEDRSNVEPEYYPSVPLPGPPDLVLRRARQGRWGILADLFCPLPWKTVAVPASDQPACALVGGGIGHALSSPSHAPPALSFAPSSHSTVVFALVHPSGFFTKTDSALSSGRPGKVSLLMAPQRARGFPRRLRRWCRSSHVHGACRPYEENGTEVASPGHILL